MTVETEQEQDIADIVPDGYWERLRARLLATKPVVEDDSPGQDPDLLF